MEDRALLRLWNLSMHSHCPIWLAGQMQQIVMDELGLKSGSEVYARLGREVVELTEEECAEILQREQAMMGRRLGSLPGFQDRRLDHRM